MNSLKTVRSLIVASAVAASALPALAYWTPIQVNLAKAAGLPPAADSVYGVRANILYGSCDTVALLDAGLFNRVTNGVYAIRAGGINWSEGDAYGLTAGVVNFDQYNAGLMAGALNYAKKGAGVQIGVINIADEYTGLQIGVLNFHFSSVIPIFPLFNMGSGSDK